MATTTDFKHRVELKVVAPPANSSTFSPNPPAQAVIDKVVPGNVTVLDKLKGYWKAIIAFIGVALLVINQVAPVLPVDWQHPAALVIAVLTAVLTFAKSNETWVDVAPAAPAAEAA